jgi:uncharacterized protein YndB with AHSA1/START domain
VGIKTEAEIEIDAPPETVFDWLTERDKLAQWTGADPEYMPADVSELKAGFKGKGHMQAPDGPRSVEFEVTACDPPSRFELKSTYDGGGSLSTYTLAPDGSGTKLHVSADTDYAAMAMPKQAEEQMEKLPAPVRLMLHHQMHEFEHQFESGAWDANPQIKAGMEQATEQQLGRFKQLVEAAR